MNFADDQDYYDNDKPSVCYPRTYKGIKVNLWHVHYEGWYWEFSCLWKSGMKSYFSDYEYDTEIDCAMDATKFIDELIASSVTTMMTNAIRHRVTAEEAYRLEDSWSKIFN